MIIGEWSVSMMIGWSVSVGLTFLFIGTFYVIKSKNKKKYMIGSSVAIFGFLLSILISNMIPPERHMYYKYKDFDNVIERIEDGWEIVSNYENKNIVHLKKGNN